MTDTTNLATMPVFTAALPHLAADAADMAALSADIGKRVRYIIPTGKAERRAFIVKHGTTCSGEFEIVGVQKDYAGRAVYRVRALAYNDTFGRPLSPALARFI